MQEMAFTQEEPRKRPRGIQPELEEEPMMTDHQMQLMLLEQHDRKQRTMGEETRQKTTEAISKALQATDKADASMEERRSLESAEEDRA